jgi:hypothetical protein
MPIKATRALLSAALDGSNDGAEYRTDANFGFAVPVAVEGVDSTILDPRSTWADRAPMTLPPTGWLACSSRTSPSSRIMLTARCSMQRPASRQQPNSYETT